MKNWKKRICLLLGILTMLSLLAGCKKKEAAAPTTEATVEPTTEPIIYSITYHLNGGIMGYDADTDYSLEDPAELPEPERANYDFIGWFAEEDFSGCLYTDTVGETGDKDFYAKWSPKQYSITYNLDGGKMEEGITNPTYYTVETDGLSFANPIKDGYTFAGWVEVTNTPQSSTQNPVDDADDEEKKPQERIIIEKGTTGDKSFKAIWTAKKPATNPTTSGRNTGSTGFSSSSTPTHTHAYKKVKYVKQSCYSEEYALMECSCGHKYKDIKKPKLEHDWEPWILVKEETPEENGIRKRSCKLCRVVESEIIDNIITVDKAGG